MKKSTVADTVPRGKHTGASRATHTSVATKTPSTPKARWQTKRLVRLESGLMPHLIRCGCLITESEAVSMRRSLLHLEELSTLANQRLSSAERLSNGQQRERDIVRSSR